MDIANRYTVATTEFILAKLGELLDYLEDTHYLRTYVAYCYMTSFGVESLRTRRILGGFKERLRQLGIETLIVKKRNDKTGNVDPRVISQAYRLLLIEKKAPSNLVLVSGDKDYEPLLVHYEKQG